MQPLSIVIAEHDPAIAHALASSLDRHFRSVKLTRSLEELRSAIPRHRVDAVVADLETVALNDVAQISRDLHVPVICTHRVPDEQMWAAAMEAGAVDVCSNEPRAVVAAISRHLAASETAA
jgi:DNA-binding NtrC family response regulator